MFSNLYSDYITYQALFTFTWVIFHESICTFTWVYIFSDQPTTLWNIHKYISSVKRPDYTSNTVLKIKMLMQIIERTCKWE